MPSFARDRRLLIAGMVGAILIVGVVIYFAFGRPPAPPEASASPGASATASPSASPSPTASPSPSPSSAPAVRLTLLVLGSDGDQARIARGADPLVDTIMVASVSAERDQITLISIPRDTVDVPMPDGSTWSGKINALYALRGIDAIRGAVETLLQVKIDHYVLLNMDDFARLIDAVGGIEVNVPFPMSDPKVRLTIGAGPQLMSGEVALKYARSRSLDSDYGRSARQQEMVLTLARAFADPSRVAQPGAVVRALSSFQTDLDLADLSAAFEAVRASRSATVTKIVLKPPRFALFVGVAGARGWVMIPNVPEMRAAAAEALAD